MRPIDADATKKDFGAHFGDVQDAVCAQQIIDRQPTIDRESLIPHGHWVHLEAQIYYCSECGVDENFYAYNKAARKRITGKEMPEYCPNCGAKMGEEVPE